jgi:N-acetylglutamate synthase-like GNAT family acetyltransferase
MYTLRPAVRGDARAIRALVIRAHLNPLGLDWHRFVVAESAQGELIACGQAKPHSGEAHELASIVVLPAWQLRGVARAVIEYLLAENPGVLYLMCRASLGKFYMRFGFRVVEEANMPGYFRSISRLFRWLNRLRPGSEGLLVMKRLSVNDPFLQGEP